MKLIDRDLVLSHIRCYEDWKCPPTSHAIHAVQEVFDEVAKIPTVNATPCDFCAYNPPSSLDGKPCTMCPATKEN